MTTIIREHHKMNKKITAICFLITLCAVLSGGCITRDVHEINRLRAIEEPDLKCSQLIGYLGRWPLAIGNPSRLAQEGLIESRSGALPYIKAALHDKERDSRARTLLLEAWVEILERESVPLLLDVARDREETPGQRATALCLLKKLNARVALPTAESLYLDETQPRAVRRAAKRAYRALK